MKDFTLSIYSDGTSAFVSDPHPKLGDEITIYVRFLRSDLVRDVLLWRLVNGAETYLNMEYDRTEGGLDHYKVNVWRNVTPSPRAATPFCSRPAVPVSTCSRTWKTVASNLKKM